MNIEDKMRMMKMWSFPEKKLKMGWCNWERQTNKQNTHTKTKQKPIILLWLEHGTQKKIALRELGNERPLLPLVKKLDFYFKYSWDH